MTIINISVFIHIGESKEVLIINATSALHSNTQVIGVQQ
jgi:hypothetical protein